MTLPARPEDLALLPERQAIQQHFDSRNYMVWRVLVMAVLAPMSMILLGIYLSEGLTTKAALAGVHLGVLVILWLLRRHSAFQRHFRAVLLIHLLAELAFLVTLAEPQLDVALCFVLVPALLLFLRLRSTEYLLVLGACTALGIFPLLWEQRAEPPVRLLAQGIGLLLPPAAVLLGALLLARRERREFLHRWRELATRERDRQRMRSELADARKIQLAMLPEGPPELDWMEISGSSLPATEVGGDFYDYLDLGNGRLAVVIGDVAGHGVSSGLVLAAVKGGLHLLRDELRDDPASVFPRLDHMVREVVRWRVIVTLSVAVLDPVERRLTVVSAGHPPPLHLPVGGTPRAVGHGALPLGTRLQRRDRRDSAPLADGDLVLFYTDGATEQAGRDDEQFGEERLAAALRSAARPDYDGVPPSPRQVREALLDALARYKRDAPQRDDVTLVVARVQGLG